MSNKRNAVEFMLWNGLDVEQAFDKLKSKFPDLTTEYVIEVQDMMNDDNFLLEE